MGTPITQNERRPRVIRSAFVVLVPVIGMAGMATQITMSAIEG